VQDESVSQAPSVDEILAAAEQSLADVTPEDPQQTDDQTDEPDDTEPETNDELQDTANRQGDEAAPKKRRRNRRRKAKGSSPTPSEEQPHGGTKRIEPLHDLKRESGLSPLLLEADGGMEPAAPAPVPHNQELQPAAPAPQPVGPTADEEALRQLGQLQKQHAEDAAAAKASSDDVQSRQPDAAASAGPRSASDAAPDEAAKPQSESDALDQMIHAGSTQSVADRTGKSRDAAQADGQVADAASRADALTVPSPAAQPAPLAAQMDHIPALPSKPMEHGDTIVIDNEGRLQFVDDEATGER
jgi:hypothetical protein